MSAYEVHMYIDNKKFSELGSPVNPDRDDIKKIKGKQDKNLYDQYVNGCNVGNNKALGHLKGYPDGNVKAESISDGLKVDFTYNDESSKTYKFMGMDIDSDFNAVIPLATGKVVVSPLFNQGFLSKAISDVCQNSRLIKDDGKYADRDMVKERLTDLFSHLPESAIREVVTNLKEGGLYSLAKEINEPDGPYKGFKKKFIDDLSLNTLKTEETAHVKDYEYKSIIMNLVNEEEKEAQDITKSLRTGAESGDLSATDITRFAFCTLCYMFNDLTYYYSDVNTIFSSIDLWSKFNKKVIGDRDFNERMSDSMKVVDMENNSVTDRVVSFSGVSEGFGIWYNSADRFTAGRNLKSYADFLGTGNVSGDVTDIDLNSVIKSNTDISDFYQEFNSREMTLEENQAFSVLDSLRYIDEDASASKNSYDMSNPDQRGLFVRSAIRSYERNFREFKPARNYDVTEALADIVDRGDIESNKETSGDEWLYGDEEAHNFRTYTEGEAVSKVNTQDLLRVMKLTNKFLKQVLDSF